MTPTEWRATGAWYFFSGLRLFITEHGAGIPILVLHAFPTASYDFYKVVARLKGYYRFILFDYPGFGFSDKPCPHVYSLFEYADVAQAVCAHFGLERVMILAHDIGDSVALELLRRGWPIVENLCLLNGSVWSIPFSDWRMLIPQRLSLHPWIGPLISKLRLFRKTSLRNFFRRIFAHPLSEAEVEAFWSLIANNNGHANYHRLLGYMPERWQHQLSWLTALETHSAPLTLVWGMVDPIATPAVADVIMQRRPSAAYNQLGGVGHYPHWEAPETVSAVLLKAWQTSGNNTSST